MSIVAKRNIRISPCPVLEGGYQQLGTRRDHFRQDDRPGLARHFPHGEGGLP
jgi:hypothetical protein